MKRTLNVVLAVVLAVAMFASVAYVASPERTSEYQISLVSVKAVNVQDATQGVRSYAELVDTTRAYQVNDVIYLAITSEVKNLEKYPTLKSIAGKDIDVVVGSPSIDLSYAKLGTPTLLANIWSGYTATDVATVGWYAPAQLMLEYDKNANEVKWTFRGYTQYGMGVSSAVATADYAKLQDSVLGNSYFAQNLVVFNPYFNTSTKKIEIPAIKLKKSESTWSLGDTTYKLDYEAPDAIGYTMVLTGVTKDNAGASKGTFYAKILISGAEKFEDFNSYWVAYTGTNKGTAYDTEAQAKAAAVTYNNETALRWSDYVKVTIKKLEIAGAYNVYKYWVPSSGLRCDVPAIYAGDKDDYNGTDTDNDVVSDGVVLAYANPTKFDNATSKDGKLTYTEAAGAVRTISAYTNWTEANSASGKTKSYPATSVIFTNYKAVYAPGFYGGTWTDETTASSGTTWSTKSLTATTTKETFSVTEDRVKRFYLTGLSDLQLADFLTENVFVYTADGIGPLSSSYYYVDKIQSTNNNTIVVTVLPAAGTAYSSSSYSNLTPLVDYEPNTTDQSWIVYYDDTSSSTLNSVTQMSTIYDLPEGYRTTFGTTLQASLRDPISGYFYATFSEEIQQNVATTNTEAVLLFGPLVNEWNEDLTITSKDQINPTKLFAELVSVGGIAGSGTLIGPAWDWTGGMPANDPTSLTTPTIMGYKDWGVTQKSGKSFVWVSIAVWNQGMKNINLEEWHDNIGLGTSWDCLYTGEFTVYLDKTSSTTGVYSDHTNAADTMYWDDGTNSIVVGHNGITMYTICSNSTDKPYITLATETNEFTNADDGYGIAMFDNINLSSVGKRIYRSNDTNLAYSVGATHVDDGSTIISAMKYFGLDTSFGTTYKVVDATFESKGAAAVYSENVEGEFQYGTITIVPDPVEEGTEEEEVEPEEEIEEPEEIDEPIEEPIDEPVEEPIKVVKTGDASANIAIALAAAAIVAAAGLAFVMKKVR